MMKHVRFFEPPKIGRFMNAKLATQLHNVMRKKQVLTLETNDRRSSQFLSSAMERLTLEVVLRDAGAKAIVADAERSMRAADLNTFIVVYFVLITLIRLDTN
jgi:hypothetical protein